MSHDALLKLLARWPWGCWAAQVYAVMYWQSAREMARAMMPNVGQRCRADSARDGACWCGKYVENKLRDRRGEARL